MNIKMLHAESAKRHVFKDSILEDFIEKQKSWYMSLQLCKIARKCVILMWLHYLIILF